MLYAVILRFNSLREIETYMLAEIRKLGHLGLKSIPKRSTLSDANARRSEKFFEDVYRNLYEANKASLSSDSRRNGTEAWIKRLRIIDSTTPRAPEAPKGNFGTTVFQIFEGISS